jgi:hypothetical protein
MLPERRIALCFERLLQFAHISWQNDMLMMMSMVHWWKDGDRRKLKYSENTLSQCHFVHHKSHTEWAGSTRWEVGDQPPELWHDLKVKHMKFKNSDPTAQPVYCFSITTTKLSSFRETVAVYRGYYTKSAIILCGRSEKFCMLKQLGGIYS